MLKLTFMFRAPLLMLLLALPFIAACSDDSDGGDPDAAPDGSSMDASADGSADATDADGSRRTVTLEITPSVVPELPTTDVEVTLALDGAPPAEGTRVYVLGDVAQNLTQLNLPALSVDPAANDRPTGDLDFSGFTLRMTSERVTVTIPSFDDATEEAPATVEFRIVPFDEVPWGELAVDGASAAAPYNVGNPSTASITLQDGP